MVETTNNTQPKQEVNPEAEIKKLLNAHMTVLKDKLGRAPTAEEIAEALKGSSEATDTTKPITSSEEVPPDTAEPKVLHLKVYYGMGKKKGEKGDVKEPDPNKVLFYEGTDGKTYDCGQQSWLDKRPDVLDHLPSRPLMHDNKNTDILRALMNGVIDDEDFSALDKSGLLNEDTKKVYALHKRANELHQQIQSLEKSAEPEIEVDVAEVTPPSTEDAAHGPAQQGVNVIKNYLDTAGVQQGLDMVQEAFGEQGVDLFQQILVAALTDVDEKTRMLVREEMERYIEPIVEAIELIASASGIDLSPIVPAVDEAIDELEDDGSEVDDEDSVDSVDESR